VDKPDNFLPHIYFYIYKAMENYRIFPQFSQVPLIYTNYPMFFNSF